ncbi:MAG: gamma-glutamyl-gamma-aminobutyrate hydrolase family protein [Bacteroidota bacterium]
MKIRNLLKLLVLPVLALLITFPSCVNDREPEPIVIGISKALPAKYYGNYAKWLNRVDTGIISVDLYHIPLDSALLLLDGCSGLILSGGPDVFPGRYDQAKDTIKCDIDYYRDTLEWALIRKAKEMEMPILGVCRGLQIFNIYHGGSLYPDIPTDFDSTIMHRCKDKNNCNHAIRVLKNSSLFKITGERTGTVNSNHHQGIHRLGKGLSAIARTDEGLIESIEYESPEDMPFFLGVQWHPERMDTLNPFSMPIAREFIHEAKSYKEREQLISHL